MAHMQPSNMMEYYRSVIDFSYTKIELSEDKLYTKKNGQTIGYLKAYNESGCSLFYFDGRPVFSQIYDDCGCFISKDGIEYFKIKSGAKWGFRTIRNLLAKFQFDELDLYWFGGVDGIVRVKNNNKYGFLRLATGHVVFDCIFDDIGHRAIQWPEDYRTASKDNRWGVISLERGVAVSSFVFRNEGEALENNPTL